MLGYGGTLTPYHINQFEEPPKNPIKQANATILICCFLRKLHSLTK
jgi:hypothetical protein